MRKDDLNAVTPPSGRELYLVRHGETAWSARGVYSGRRDIPLTARGTRQAAEAGRRLENAGVDLIVASPLRRALDTAGAIAETTGAPVTADARLTEVDYGPLEGLDRAAALERHGEEYANWRERPFHATPPGVEPLGSALARARAAVEDALAGGTPVIVAHQGILRLVLVALEAIEPREYFDTRIPEATPIRVPVPWHPAGAPHAPGAPGA